MRGSAREGARAEIPRQNVVEYGLLIACIALVILLGVSKSGTLIVPWFTALAGHSTTVGT